MTEEGTLCNNADVVKKAGANASSTSTDEAYTNIFIKMAEGAISARTRYDWVTNYSDIGSTYKELLRDMASSYAAAMAINYDMSGFTSRQEALTMININWAIFTEGMRTIEEGKNRVAMGAE